jgi:hypothetical protein
MSDFKTRLINEKELLNDKIEKLEKFLESDMAQKIDNFQFELLELQLTSMLTYHGILKVRLRWLETT